MSRVLRRCLWATSSITASNTGSSLYMITTFYPFLLDSGSRLGISGEGIANAIDRAPRFWQLPQLDDQIDENALKGTTVRYIFHYRKYQVVEVSEEKRGVPARELVSAAIIVVDAMSRPHGPGSAWQLKSIVNCLGKKMHDGIHCLHSV